MQDNYHFFSVHLFLYTLKFRFTSTIYFNIFFFIKLQHTFLLKKKKDYDVNSYQRISYVKLYDMYKYLNTFFSSSNNYCVVFGEEKNARFFFIILLGARMEIT